MDPSPLVDEGDIIIVSWPAGEGDDDDQDQSKSTEYSQFECRVVSITRSKRMKHNSHFKYKLLFLPSNDDTPHSHTEQVVRSTRLAHLDWSKKKLSKKLKKSHKASPDPSPLKNPNPQPSPPNIFASLKFICAPMVGGSELPFRLLCRRYGATLAYTPMLNSGKFATDSEYRYREFTTIPSDRPLVAHFSANDPMLLLQAAKLVESQCDAIDLNLGCPQRVAFQGTPLPPIPPIPPTPPRQPIQYTIVTPIPHLPPYLSYLEPPYVTLIPHT